MDRKYWVPALERADLILMAIARKPGEHKLTDLCEVTEINKSSMFSLLRTMETLNWVKRDEKEAYALGAGMAYLNTVFNESHKQNYNLVSQFLQASLESVRAVGETFQLSVLDRSEIIYLAKQEGPSLVKLASSPGMRFPAHATAMGKMMLALLPPEELDKRYPGKLLSRVTSRTVTDWQVFTAKLAEIRSSGHSVDFEEIIEGICCVAAPVTDASGRGVAAVSTSMLRHAYLDKQETALQEVTRLGKKLSLGIQSGASFTS
ncbi:IclR family transcriptional regulator [Paenibacillus sp. MMS20-IR301]|uniref:IclR family transcriptional regulator n=1 Tax=Paenibacillus sp. MMS20-IR301 TaxID=2895946 RepID=UPI0028E28E72|nr:IclR family transcriptional regulator [Paenibacillus sp. MMS20-IR301]WNS46043.1 IclR family transcriptional regulator [Paenibacillus sp. MMS20-IR301]